LESDEVTLGALLGCPSVFGGASPCGFFPECPVCRIREPLRKTFREGSPLVDLELPWRKKTESELSHIRLSAIPLPFRLSGEPLALLTLEDVTQRKSSEEEIRRLAYHDSLTGLPNRTLFYDRLKVAMVQARRSRKGLAVMFLDLDRFKEVNDSLGHSMGDALLKVAGERLNGLLRKGDTVSRMGGDEFLLMLPETSRHEDAARIARKILDAFQEPFAVGGHEIRITTSIGIALYPEEGEDADTLMKKADIAMYRAKEMGRNNYQCSGRDGDGEPVGGPTPESVGGSGQQDG
jgi:diguanylate cyclase (GGDEF)-like protein